MTTPQVERYVVKETVFRIITVVLAVCGIIVGVGSTCIDAAVHLRGVASYASLGVATNGWFVFLSLLVTVFQMFAIAELFTDIKLLSIKIMCLSGSQWYLFAMIKLVVSSVSIIGYLGVLMPMTAFTIHWIAEAIELNENGDSDVRDRLSPGYVQLSLSAMLVLLFSLANVVQSMTMVIFILLAKNKYRWPKYSPIGEMSAWRSRHIL